MRRCKIPQLIPNTELKSRCGRLLCLVHPTSPQNLAWTEHLPVHIHPKSSWFVGRPFHLESGYIWTKIHTRFKTQVPTRSLYIYICICVCGACTYPYIYTYYTGVYICIYLHLKRMCYQAKPSYQALITGGKMPGNSTKSCSMAMDLLSSQYSSRSFEEFWWLWQEVTRAW